MLTRLRALVIKELLVILRDPRGRIVIIVPPLVQLIIFSFAATLEVKNVDIAILNQDAGRQGRELIQRIDGSNTFRHLVMVPNPTELRAAIDRQRVLAAIQIGATFSRDLSAHRPADLQIILDGRRSNAAQIVAGYLGQIVDRFGADVSARPVERPPVIASRNWFNPNLEYTWFTVPGLIAIIALLVGLIVTALSVARERELGTFDQLMVLAADADLHQPAALLSRDRARHLSEGAASERGRAKCIAATGDRERDAGEFRVVVPPPHGVSVRAAPASVRTPRSRMRTTD
jgi:ABC-2 type transport system permease protein